MLNVIAARIQVESTDSRIADINACVTIANRQGIRWVELIIDSRTDSYSALGCHRGRGERIDDLECSRIECDCIDYRTVVDRVPTHIKEKRSLLVDGAAHASAIFLKQERRLLLSVGIA